ncbi:MAG: D-aminoacyl-tRNA deacylase [Proteobacteria bacterium]|nr:D-aminoacyl-tRNA deacylase [Pseudomonadota bacterium]
MIALIQRVSKAEVKIAGLSIGKINTGILALIGVEKTDTQNNADKLLKKICNYRIFPDHNDKMNLSLNEIKAELLLVSQFTLIADTKKGNRPGFSHGAPPELGKQMFDYLVAQAHQTDLKIQSGEFAANMQVSLCNDGPVTFWLQT